MQSNSRHVLIHLHVAALLLGGTAQFSKLLPFSAINIIAYRTLICGLFVLAVALALKQRVVTKNGKELALMLFCSALFTIHWTAYFHAMQVSSVAVGIVSMFSFPVITVFLEPLLTQNKLHLIDVLMGGMVLLGIALIVPEFSLTNGVTQGVLFGLISALAVALRNILVSKSLKSYSAFTIMSYHGFVSALLLLPFVTVYPNDIGSTNWLLLILLGTLFTAVPHTQKTFGLRFESAKKVSMIVSLQVVYATIIAYFLLGEVTTWQTILGGSLILIAAMFESARPRPIA